MEQEAFNYEEVFMSVREAKPKSFFLPFKKEYRLRSLVRAVKVCNGRMLDIGCGGGILTEALSFYFPHAAIYGCDVSATAIRFAEKLGSGKARFAVIKKNRFPYKDNFFNVCICLDVLEHVRDVDLFLQEVKRVLRENGLFFLIVPCEGQPFTFTWFFQKTGLGKDLSRRNWGHIHPEFTHQYVIKLLEKHGFTVKEKTYSEHVLYQLLLILIIVLPKLLLELILGKGVANRYSDSQIVISRPDKNDPLFVLRRFWYGLKEFFWMYPLYWETILLRHVAPFAWKLHILSSKDD